MQKAMASLCVAFGGAGKEIAPKDLDNEVWLDE
jgi:hypothetical protein